MMDKETQYKELLTQLRALLADETDMIASMANMCAVLHERMNFWWTGFYLVKDALSGDQQELVLGPFQGPVACMRIAYGKGVCGTAWARKETLVVPNVHMFAGHIACSSASNSEIVIPLLQGDKVIAVLDIDSTNFAAFDDIDKKYLEETVRMIECHF